MAGMYGADVAQLRELAARFSREADRLEGDRMTVANAIQVSAWMGPVAVRFRHEWESSHSRALLSAAGALREAANRLRTNADQQERASAVDGGGASRPDLSEYKIMPGTIQNPVFGDRRFTVENAFNWLGQGMDFRLFDGIPILEEFDLQFIGGKVSPVSGLIMDAIGLGDLLVDSENSLAEKAFGTAGVGIDAAAGVLKTTGPVGYLFGVAASQTWDVVELTATSDWSQETVQRTFSYMWENPGDSLDGAADAVKGYLPDLVSNFWI